MNLRILISRRAKREIREIVEWIGTRSSKGASSWLDSLEKNLEQLRTTVTSSSPAIEGADFDVDLRQRLFKTRRGNMFRLIFIIQGDTIHILSIRGTGQDLLHPSDIEIPE